MQTRSKAAGFPAQQQSCAQQGFHGHQQPPPGERRPGRDARARGELDSRCFPLRLPRSGRASVSAGTPGRGLLGGAAARLASPGRRVPGYGSLQPSRCPLRGPGRRPLLGRRPVLNPGGPVAPCRAAGGPGLALRAPWALAAGVFPPRRPGSPCEPGGGCCLVSRRPRLVVSGPPARRGLGLRGPRRPPRLVPGASSARFPAWFLAPPRPLRPCALPARALFLRAHAESIPPASGLLPVAACPGDFAPPQPRQDRADQSGAPPQPGPVPLQLRY